MEAVKDTELLNSGVTLAEAIRVWIDSLRGRGSAHCPWCQHFVSCLVKHHISYIDDDTINICLDCHFREHYPEGKEGPRVILGIHWHKKYASLLGVEYGHRYMEEIKCVRQRALVR